MGGWDKRPLQVLKLLFFHPEGLRFEEIRTSLGLSPYTLRKALVALEEEGFTALDPQARRYLLRYPHPFLELPEPVDDTFFYQELVDGAHVSTGLRAYALTVRPWGLHLEATTGHQGQRLWPFPKERKPVTAHAHASAGGRAILAYLREDLVRAHFQRFPPRAFTPHSPSTIPQVLERLAEVRTLGYARARGEIIPERCGLALPLLGKDGQAFGALGLSLPFGQVCAYEHPEDPKACRRCLEVAPVLREVVSQVWPSSEA
ncbi:IclR family transcriptional regulator [Thermus caldifontis]|uniref:IclR family transcriptional regulator n=1 Tax=Thermus caldifontis TaxID=1930763 RepID=UPI000DF3A0B4